jgi:hypothetical protein
VAWALLRRARFSIDPWCVVFFASRHLSPDGIHPGMLEVARECRRWLFEKQVRPFDGRSRLDRSAAGALIVAGA